MLEHEDGADHQQAAGDGRRGREESAQHARGPCALVPDALQHGNRRPAAHPAGQQACGGHAPGRVLVRNPHPLDQGAEGQQRQQHRVGRLLAGDDLQTPHLQQQRSHQQQVAHRVAVDVRPAAHVEVDRKRKALQEGKAGPLHRRTAHGGQQRRHQPPRQGLKELQQDADQQGGVGCRQVFE